MAFQPSEDDIQNFMAVIPEVNRQEAIARIKVDRLRNLGCKQLTKQGNSNNVEYAINEYYEDGGNRTKVCYCSIPRGRFLGILIYPSISGLMGTSATITKKEAMCRTTPVHTFSLPPSNPVPFGMSVYVADVSPI